jgi:hypothetical protein
MTIKPAALSVILLAGPVLAAQSPDALPWKVNKPIVSVKKELFAKHPGEKTAAMGSVFYAGPNLERMETRQDEGVSDQTVNLRVRFSTDNGRTWSSFQQLPNSVVTYAGVHVWEGPDNAMPLFDSRAGVLVQPWLRQVFLGNGFYNAAYYRISTNHGQTWSAPRQLKYEPGPDFDPANPSNPAFLTNNLAFPAQNLTLTGEGKLVLGVHAVKDPAGSNHFGGELLGALNFIGTWNGLTGAAADYTWTHGNRVIIAANRSSRGLQETGTAQLKNGRVINIWRGSNYGLSGSDLAAAGHKWLSISCDGGLTLGPIQELKYDDGTPFFSPSSFHRLLRLQSNGKLYWFGNICSDPPDGNWPRHPLIVAEVDENKVALKRSTVTAIDDQQPGQSPKLQLSNFSLLEDRETHRLEMVLTLYSEDPSDWRNADCYKYTLTLK